MPGRRHATFVLLPGAWSGAWSWEPVRSRLAASGHDARALTLSGLRPNEDVSSIGLSDHVEEVIARLDAENLRDVVLVGHSYSGIVAGQVAERSPDRVAHTVYVQAFLPLDGQALLDAFGEEGKAAELADITAHDGYWPPPSRDGIAAQSDLTDAQIGWLAHGMVPHPGRTVTEPTVMCRPLTDQPSTFIASTFDGHGVEHVRDASRWRFVTLSTGHWPMLSQPDRLADLLGDIRSSR